MLLFDATLSVLGLIIFCQATFYHPSLAGGIMRNGQIYDPEDSSVIAIGINDAGEPVMPMGTKLKVCSSRGCLIGIVQDSGYLGKNIDLSPAAFSRLADLDDGRIWVSITCP